MHIVLDYSHKAVGCDGSTDLNQDGILRSAPEFLDLKMLLEPLEEVMRSFT